MAMSDRYELLLIGIPVALGFGALASTQLPISLHHGLAGGSLLSTALLYEGLFRNPPIEPTPKTDAAAASAVGIGWLLTFLILL